MLKFTLLIATSLITSLSFAADIGVDVEWSAKSKCSQTSPVIHLSNLPTGATRAEVAMRDQQVPDYYHGGGEVTIEVVDGKATIPEGALKDFRSPCPPDGQTHPYRFKVSAGGESGKATFDYPPK